MQCDLMTNDYVEYLQSKEWNRRRSQRLILSNNRCEACGKRKRLHVHHLTYKNVFHETMDDLMTLCDICHTAIEAAIVGKMVGRTGDPHILRRITIAVIGAHHAPVSSKKPKPSPVIGTGVTKQGLSAEDRTAVRMDIREKLLGDPEVASGLSGPREDFKKMCRSKFKKHPQRNQILANAIILFDYPKKRMEVSLSRTLPS